jgi:quercetin dioxygenase-like cupin family protein
MFPHVALSKDKTWQPGPYAGVELMVLHKSPTTGGVTVLRKFKAGVTVPAHTHPEANETAYVLSGEWEESGVTYTTGTLFFAPKGERHGPHVAKTEVISLDLRRAVDRRVRMPISSSIGTHTANPSPGCERRPCSAVIDLRMLLTISEVLLLPTLSSRRRSAGVLPPLASAFSRCVGLRDAPARRGERNRRLYASRSPTRKENGSARGASHLPRTGSRFRRNWKEAPRTGGRAVRAGRLGPFEDSGAAVSRGSCSRNACAIKLSNRHSMDPVHRELKADASQAIWTPPLHPSLRGSSGAGRGCGSKTRTP